MVIAACLASLALMMTLLFLDEVRMLFRENRRKLVAGILLVVTGLSGVALAASEVVYQDLRIMGRLFVTRQVVNIPQSDSCADNGVGSSSPACTLQPTSSVVLYTCADADGCALTLAEASDVYSGERLTILVVGSNRVTMADSAGVQELVNSFSGQPTEVIGFVYNGSAWLETFRVATTTRSVPLPVTAFVPCDTGIWTASGADVLPNFLVVSNALAIQYDATVGTIDTTEVCTSFVVPATNVGTSLSVYLKAKQEGATVTNVESLSCRVSINGAAMGAASTSNLANNTNVQAITLTPTGTVAAGDSVALACKQGNAAADDAVDILAVEARFTAGG